MKRIFFRTAIRTAMLSAVVIVLVLPAALQAQTNAAKSFKTNCVLCHAADGSGSSPTGKALQAKDLRSAEVQKQSDADLTTVISKGRGKMPAFAAKLKADEIKDMVAYIRDLAKTKK